MRKAWFLLLLLAACSASVGDDGEASTTDDIEGSSEEALTNGMLDTEEAAFLSQINTYRVGKGLSKLHVSIALTRASKAHLNDMAAHMKMQHDSFDGTSWDQRIKNYYNYNTYLGENVAYGFTTAPDVFTAWKNSPEHNANMLGANYTVIGIARAADKNGTFYWTTDFGGYTDAVLSLGFGTIAANGSFESSSITPNVAFGAVRTLNRWHTNGSDTRRSGGAAAGTYYMRQTNSASVTEVVRGAANVNYRVTAKTRQIAGTPQSVYLDFLDGNFARINVTTTPSAAASAWTGVQAQATSPAGTKYVRVILYSNHAGTVDYDDVRVAAW